MCRTIAIHVSILNRSGRTVWVYKILCTVALPPCCEQSLGCTPDAAPLTVLTFAYGTSELILLVMASSP